MASEYAKELMLTDLGENFVHTKEEMLEQMHILSVDFHTLYQEAVSDDLEDGKYKDINYNNVLIWHEYRDGKFYEIYVSLIDMLSRLAQLTTVVAAEGTNAPN
jgi:hypothetical protein